MYSSTVPVLTMLSKACAASSQYNAVMVILCIGESLGVAMADISTLCKTSQLS